MPPPRRVVRAPPGHVSPSTLGSPYNSRVSSGDSSHNPSTRSSDSSSSDSGSLTSSGNDELTSSSDESSYDETSLFERMRGSSEEEKSAESSEDCSNEHIDEAEDEESGKSVPSTRSTSTRTIKSDASSYGFSSLEEFGYPEKKDISESSTVVRQWISAAKSFFHSETPPVTATKKPPRLSRKLRVAPRKNKAPTWRQAYKEVQRRKRAFQKPAVCEKLSDGELVPVEYLKFPTAVSPSDLSPRLVESLARIYVDSPDIRTGIESEHGAELSADQAMIGPHVLPVVHKKRRRPKRKIKNPV
ncbi:hypothetical protein WR25_12522 [Diploscapter pachys]|uniref:Uncharacterized protein n=1 Tax=Diploscapter pachys TaxID=2018661 RepID=A0A2A2JV32_9BILA|nr:hypothetical protein WR25_12522 [Diploscapter pachys]